MATTLPNKNEPLKEKGLGSYLPVIAGLCLLCGVPCALVISCASIMYPAVASDLGVPVSQISLYSSFTFISSFLVSSYIGRLFERYDARVLLSAGVALIALACVIMGSSTAPWMFWVAGFICGIGTTSLLGIAPAVIVNRWFRKNTGLFMGVVLSFTGIGGAIFMPIGQAIIDAYGWHVTYYSYAAATLIVGLIVSLFVIRSYPSERGLLPYGEAWAESGESKNRSTVLDSVPVKLAMKTSIFWLLGLVCAIINFNVKIAFFFPTYVNSLANAGVSVLITGAVLSSIAMVGQAVAKILLGGFSDFSVKNAIIGSCGLGILGCCFCWFGATTILMPIGGFIFGFFYAAALVLAPMVTREVLGSGKNFPIFWARLNACATVGSALGTYLWPLISEQFGGFDAVFGLGIVLIAVVLVLCLWLVGKRDALPRVRDDESELENVEVAA